MTRDTFVVRTDADTGLKYVVKRKDELTKNHRGDDSESFSGFMPEYSRSELCTVRKNMKRYCNQDVMHCGKGLKNSSTVQIENGITMLPLGKKLLITL